MRVLMVHERYRQRGGEDRVFDVECALLAERGIDVVPFVRDNHDIDPDQAGLGLALETLWSRRSRLAVEEAILAHRPDVMHCHNLFPLLSPSVYQAARSAGIPVIQTLHNYRPLCLNALLSRQGQPCEDCLSATLKWRGVVRRCYRDGVAASAAVAAWAGAHRMLGTWSRKVDMFFVLSPFSRSRFIQAGWPAERLAIKPNTMPDPGAAAVDWNRSRAGALFVGRLSPEKGIAGLVEAWRDIGHPLTVIGDGPLATSLRAMAGPEVSFLGALPPERVSEELRRAALVCVPSTCHENFPLAVLEAMAHGLPVLASDLGALADMVDENKTGRRVPAQDRAAWRQAAIDLLNAPGLSRRMGEHARSRYERDYAPDPVMDRQIALYHSLLESR